MRNGDGVEGGGGLQGRGSGRFGPRHFKVYDYFLTLELVNYAYTFHCFSRGCYFVRYKKSFISKTFIRN